MTPEANQLNLEDALKEADIVRKVLGDETFPPTSRDYEDASSDLDEAQASKKQAAEIRARRAALGNNPEQTIKDVVARIKEITRPRRTVPLNDVPEFGAGAKSAGLVSEVVSQGHLGTTEKLPIRTDNLDRCHAFLIKTPHSEGDKYTLVHVLSGNLEDNAVGARQDDIRDLTNLDSTAIAITGDSSHGITGTAWDLKYEGITTVKHIHASGGRYVSVVYKPESDEIVVRVGADVNATEAQIYEGFK